MFVIVNIHKNYNEGKTYLSFDDDYYGKYYFGSDFRGACIFDDRESAKRKWNEVISKVAFYEPSDSVMLEYINLQPDDPL